MKRDFIPWIFNFCDRWCERCAFTSKCRVFAFQEKDEEDGGEMVGLWSGQTHITIDLTAFEELGADKENLDIFPFPDAESIRQKLEEIDRVVRSHPLRGLAKRYQETAEPFIEAFESHVQHRMKEIEQACSKGDMSYAEGRTVAADLKECGEVIRWYFYFIEIKLMRALAGKLNEDNDNLPDPNGEYPSDSDGSAKIALIAIEKTSGAWKKLGKILPAANETAAAVTRALDSLVKMIIDVFPDAPSFKRPGFDTIKGTSVFQ